MSNSRWKEPNRFNARWQVPRRVDADEEGAVAAGRPGRARLAVVHPHPRLLSFKGRAAVWPVRYSAVHSAARSTARQKLCCLCRGPLVQVVPYIHILITLTNGHGALQRRRRLAPPQRQLCLLLRCRVDLLAVPGTNEWADKGMDRDRSAPCTFKLLLGRLDRRAIHTG